MPRFFVTNDAVEDGVIRITGADAHHISYSLRMAVGERITVCDEGQNEYECVLESFLEDAVEARILDKARSDREPLYRATVYQALPKGDKLDSIIQKSVECGVYEIVPFESERCIVKVKPDAERKKTERRTKIAAEAAKQSGRAMMPKVRETISFSEMLKEASAADVPIFCYEGEATHLLGEAFSVPAMQEMARNGKVPTISIVIGSEGGFSRAEAEAARDAGMLICNLGKRILRTETAASFVLSALVFAFELCP